MQQGVCRESYKYVCFDAQNSHATWKSKWQALYELKLT
jgi:hypothetical protein